MKIFSEAQATVVLENPHCANAPRFWIELPIKRRLRGAYLSLLRRPYAGHTIAVVQWAHLEKEAWHMLPGWDLSKSRLKAQGWRRLITLLQHDGPSLDPAMCLTYLKKTSHLPPPWRRAGTLIEQMLNAFYPDPGIFEGAYWQPPSVQPAILHAPNLPLILQDVLQRYIAQLPKIPHQSLIETPRLLPGSFSTRYAPVQFPLVSSMAADFWTLHTPSHHERLQHWSALEEALDDPIAFIESFDK